MMVGSLESDIKDVESAPLDSLVVDDFEDTDEKKEISIHNSEVKLNLCSFDLLSKDFHVWNFRFTYRR